MSSFKKLIKADLYRHGRLTGLRGFLRGWFRPGFRPGFRYTVIFRLLTSQKNAFPFRFLLRLLRRRYRFKYGYEIDLNAKIGEGFYLSNHCGTIVIGPVQIGKYCNVAHLVTIGRAYKKGQLGRPTIGDRVWIGTGSVLVGKITVGSNVIVAPNTFVNIDVPDNSIVMGNPAKIISKDNPTRFYINDILNDGSDE